VIISQSELNHSQSLFDHEYLIERGANGAVRHAAA
jgi:branched-chain amino acid transport system ATP-binding protein